MQRVTARQFQKGFQRLEEPVLINDGIYFPRATPELIAIGEGEPMVVRGVPTPSTSNSIDPLPNVTSNSGTRRFVADTTVQVRAEGLSDAQKTRDEILRKMRTKK